MIDAEDKRRFYNVDKLISELLIDPVLEMKTSPMVFLANKQDLDQKAVDDKELRKVFNLESRFKKKKRKFILNGSSGYTGYGLEEAL